MEKHRCGGTLLDHQVVIKKKVGSTTFLVSVAGKRCDRCFEEVVSRETALELERTPIKLETLYGQGQDFVITLDEPIMQGVPDAQTEISNLVPISAGTV